ncbi:MAG: efflux RND transporter periplasmic adaptor subunit [Planctomycetaceae bacterium]|nr:efflux RND transporter periplasmic adaptor subunit [Planctomycetaceae bacterium]
MHEHVPAEQPDETADSPPPPHGPRLRVILALVIASAAALLVGIKLGGQLHPNQPETPQTQQAAKGKQYYTCGMHPWVVLPNPGDCPICHMKLIPLDPAKFSGEVTISPEMTQNIGVRIAPVTTGPLTSVIRTIGSVDYDETRLRDVSLKIGGFVQKLHVDTTGEPVQKGQPLLEIYSPELYAAQEEYLTAYRDSRTLGKADASAWSRDLLAAARKRLENFDISPQQIAELEKSGKASKTMVLSSPYQGLVVSKNVVAGQKVEPDMVLYRIADLSRVWVMVTVYEYQIPFIQSGQKAVMTLPYIPGQTFQGKVAYIYPTVNQETRQVKVRMEFENPALLLKPGMFVNVELRNTLARDRILVPREAVIDTGSRQVAFVSLGEGRFEPRVVKVGAEGENGTLEILDGLKSGEMVVTSGNFLLDSEARLREALVKMVRGDPAAAQKTQAAPTGASELTTLPEGMAREISLLAENYFVIGQRLSEDTITGVDEPARRIAASVDRMIAIAIPGHEHFWHQHMEAAEIRGKALELIEAKDLAKAREIFADLSMAMSKLLKATGVPPTFGKEVQELHCPMYRQGQGGTWWLQAAGKTRNPYYGQSMLECKDQQLALPVTGAPPSKPRQVAP